MTALTLRAIEFRHRSGPVAVDRLDLSVDPGELFVLLGPSGCGKTSTLRLIAGLSSPTAGDILFDGRPMGAVPPNRRNAAMVFQHHELVPFRTVAANVAFGLRLRRVPEPERSDRVARALASVQLDGFGHRWPAELSGGERQRVALARALVVEPRLLLLDEPLSDLDRNLRIDLGRMIRDLQRRMGITTVMVTHDQSEAAAVADRIGVMIEGRLRQVATPEELWADPIDAAVAAFLGDPPAPEPNPGPAAEPTSARGRGR